MRRRKFFERVMYVVLSAMLYIVFDIPIAMTEYLKFAPCIGLKNALTPIYGLTLGPYGVLGSVLGSLASAPIVGRGTDYMIFEAYSNAIIGLFVWLFWHFTTRTHKVNFKTTSCYVRYIGSLLIASTISGCLGLVTVGEDFYFLAIVISFTVLGSLCGIPINVIVNGVLCIKPIIPGWYATTVDLEGDIEPTDESLIAFNERAERFADEHGCNVKKSFEILSTIEEVYLRIRANEPNSVLHITLDYDDTLSIRFEYKGEKINPLKIQDEEDLAALIGLKLIEHRAIRTSYRYTQGVNHIHVVI